MWLLLEHLMMRSMVDEPSLEPCSCDVVDEGEFLYCFLTSSINSSHRATPFGKCSFSLHFFLFFFSFFLLLFRDTKTLSRNFFVWCVALCFVLIVCFNVVKLDKGESEFEMVEQAEWSKLGAARKHGGRERLVLLCESSVLPRYACVCVFTHIVPFELLYS